MLYIFSNLFSVCPYINETCSGVQGHFVCKETGQCISKRMTCDCSRDCRDNSDEEYCHTSANSSASIAHAEAREQEKKWYAASNNTSSGFSPSSQTATKWTQPSSYNPENYDPSSFCPSPPSTFGKHFEKNLRRTLHPFLQI